MENLDWTYSDGDSTPGGIAIRVLLVDDDSDLRILLRTVLTHAGGFEISEAVDGRSALDAIALAPPPDIVVTDLMMPGMTGMELIRRIRLDPLSAGIRILVVSGNAGGEEGEEIRGMVDALMAKDAIYPGLLPVMRSLAPGLGAATAN